jgi:predicted permease
LYAPLPIRGASEPPTRVSHYLAVFARMKDGVSLEQARAEMDRLGVQLEKEHPVENRGHGIHVTLLREELVGPVRTGLLLMWGAVVFVLLIACANVANLLLAQAAARRREMALRAALGASRARLARQALVESAAIACAGGLAGLAVGRLGIAALRWGAAEAGLDLDRLTLDLRVAGFALGASAAAGLLFGLLPAWQLARQDVNEPLKEQSRSPVAVRREIRLALVASEVALASLLLVGAGVTLKSFRTLLGAEAGFRIDGVLTAAVSLPPARYPEPARMLTALAGIEERLAAAPGVRAVGATSFLPLAGMDGRRGLGIEGRAPTPEAPRRAHPRSATPGYRDALGLTMAAGRWFTAADDERAPLVAVVNEETGRRYWGDQTPIGSRVSIGGTEEWREVVGVVRDVRFWGLGRAVNPEVYVPLRQFPASTATFALLADGDPAALAPSVREAVRAVDSELPVSAVMTMAQHAARSTAARRTVLVLLSIFAVVALALAAAGIYGVMGRLVSLRRGEIGVRMALGASPRDMMRLIMREGLGHAFVGLAGGMAGGVVLAQVFRAMLYETSPADPWALAGTAGLLLASAAAACYAPARRAMRVDPATALRDS